MCIRDSNKFDRKGAEDALRDVAKQVQRNREDFSVPPEQMPVYGTMASRFNDDGVSALYKSILAQLNNKGLSATGGALSVSDTRHSTDDTVIVPSHRSRYLAEIAETVRGYHKTAEIQASVAREKQQLQAALALMQSAGVEIDEDGVSELIIKRERLLEACLLYTSPSPRDATLSRMPSSA